MNWVKFIGHFLKPPIIGSVCPPLPPLLAPSSLGASSPAVPPPSMDCVMKRQKLIRDQFFTTKMSTTILKEKDTHKIQPNIQRRNLVTQNYLLPLSLGFHTPNQLNQQKYFPKVENFTFWCHHYLMLFPEMYRAFSGHWQWSVGIEHCSSL